MRSTEVSSVGYLCSLHTRLTLVAIDFMQTYLWWGTRGKWLLR